MGLEADPIDAALVLQVMAQRRTNTSAVRSLSRRLGAMAERMAVEPGLPLPESQQSPAEGCVRRAQAAARGDAAAFWRVLGDEIRAYLDGMNRTTEMKMRQLRQVPRAHEREGAI